MSAFSERDFDAEHYDRCRPTYPDGFYRILDGYHQGKRQLLVDVGCGPGTATLQMTKQLKGFEEIIGTDISSTMVRRAQNSRSSLENAQVSFVVAPCDDFAFLGHHRANKQAIDMITAVECVHWFDYHNFQASIAKNLRSGGTIAIWGYADAIFLDYPDLDGILNDLAYGEDQLGPYWEQPGRQKLRSRLASWGYSQDKFTNILEVDLEASSLRTVSAEDIQPPPLVIVKQMTLADYVAYVKTWSSYHVWHKKYSGLKPDFTDELVERVHKLHPELTSSSKITVAWNTFYKFARRL